MRRRRHLVTHAPLLLIIFLALAAIASQSVRAQEKVIQFGPRQQMIDAIVSHASSRGCGTFRNVLGSAFEDACDKAGTAADVVDVFKRARAALALQDEQALIELCKKHQLLDCQQEASTGRPVLTFDASLSVRADPSTGAWSPNGRQLIVYEMGQPKGQTRVIDAERVHLGPLITEGAQPRAIAWSADGKYIALNGLKLGPMAASPVGLRLYASDTLEEKGNIAPAKQHQCNFAVSREMAFTADSKALWVSCGGTEGGWPSPSAIAIKLGVPGLEMEDSLLPTPLAPDTQFRFGTYELSSRNDDLVLTGLSRPSTYLPAPNKQQVAAQSFSLRTKKALHPPVFMPLRFEDGSLRWVRNVLSADDLSAVLVHIGGSRTVYAGGVVADHPEAAEVWSTEGRGLMEAGPATATLERFRPPDRIAQLGMHLKTRADPNPSLPYTRSYLVVLDSQSGATIQELGPITTGVHKILVSPNGTRVAVIGPNEIRFYRVNP